MTDLEMTVKLSPILLLSVNIAVNLNNQSQVPHLPTGKHQGSVESKEGKDKLAWPSSISLVKLWLNVTQYSFIMSTYCSQSLLLCL